MPTPLPAAAIIAGGVARRFGGRDKSRLVVRGRTIIVRQVEVLQRIADPVFVVAAEAARFADLGLAVHPDVVSGVGALGGILTALEVSPSDRVLTVGGDLPFLSAGLLGALDALSDGHDGAWVETRRGAEPLLACYRRSAAAAIRTAIAEGDFKAAGLGRRLDIARLTDAEVARFGPLDELLANINTPEDYARIQ